MARNEGKDDADKIDMALNAVVIQFSARNIDTVISTVTSICD